MLPRLSDIPAPASLYGDFLAELRLRGFEGDLAPGYADRVVSATDNSIYQLVPQAIAFPRSTRGPRAHRQARRRSRASRSSCSRRAAAAPAPTASR